MIILDNAHVSFGFDEQTGSLVQITDKTTGRQHLNDPARGRLFRIVCPSATWMSRYADAQESGPPEITKQGQQLTIHFPRLKAMDGPLEIAATVRVELPIDQPEARFTLEITNNSADRLHEVRFPWVGGWTGIDGRGVDRCQCGVTPVDPYPKSPEIFHYNLMGAHRRQYMPYTNCMMLPFVDLSGKDCGISYINYQDRPNMSGVVTENLDPEPDGLSFSFSWVHFPFTKPGESWQSLPIGIGVHEGDWHATADRFRAWADGWWQAPHPPERLVKSIGYQVIMLRNFDGLPNHRLADVPQLAQDGLQYGVEDLCVWDPIAGVYLRPDDGDFWEEFDPSQRLDNLKAGLEVAKRVGVNVSTLVNYRLIRENSALYREIGDAQVQRTVYGSPVNDDWSTCSSAHASFRTGYLGTRGVALCQRPDSFRERALAITRQTLDLGFTSLFVDQAFDYNPCLSEEHGHRSPDDTHEAAIEWFTHAAEMVRAHDPDAYVIGEITDLYGMQHLDLSWNWSWADVWSNPAVIRYTLPETLHCWVVDHQPKVLNHAFIMGFLAAFTTGMAEQSLAAYPAFGARVAQLAALKLQCAEFLVQGTFRDQHGLEAEGAAAYIYRTPGGLAVAFGDTAGKTEHVRLTIDPAVFGLRASAPRVLYRQDGSTLPISTILPDGRVRLEMDLPELEVGVLAIPCVTAKP
ncbi:MAG: hypothetical protein ACYDBB_26305 [Armatimonadota bacterium]